MESELNRSAADALQGRTDKIARDVSGAMNEASDVLKDYGNRKLESARQAWTQAQSVMNDGYRQAADVTDEYVHTNPWKAIGVAAAAGVLIGLLLGRR